MGKESKLLKKLVRQAKEQGLQVMVDYGQAYGEHHVDEQGRLYSKHSILEGFTWNPHKIDPPHM